MMHKHRFLLLLIGALLLPAGLVALAQAEYEIVWWTVDGGGASALAGGGYTLAGTAGQPDAGVSAGGGYTLGGGFWQGGAAIVSPYAVYLPLAMR